MKKKLIKLGKYLYDHYALQVCLLEGFGSCIILILDQVLYSVITEAQRERIGMGLIVNIIFTGYIILSEAYTEFNENWEDQ